MPNSRAVRRNSVVDMLSKVHVNRGSLLKSIENLLKTIEVSESAVMIPTLLRDKCEFDAWELLFVAKILKASILGHNDLVEFYMNHLSHQAAKSNVSTPSNCNGTTTSANGNGSLNGLANDLPSPIASPGGTQLSASPSLSTTSSINSSTTTTSSQQQQQQQSRSQSSQSWITANQQSQASISSGSFSNGSQSSSVSSTASSTSSNGTSNGVGLLPNSSSNQNSSLAIQNQQSNQETGPTSPRGSSLNSACCNQDTFSYSPDSTPMAARPLLMRQAQPPSLLQLTTTNNHINSVAAVSAGFTNNSIEQLTNQLTAMANISNGNQNGTSNGNNNNNTSGTNNLNTANNSNGFTTLATNSGKLHGALSISTTVANQQSSAHTSINGSTPTGLGAHHAELRTSRSAGCLFRINSSGASSPRTPAQTPTTPYPQAETLANGLLANSLLAADPAAPVKLLLQIEQLKTSINHVTNLLESVVELYKKSIDNIAN